MLSEEMKVVLQEAGVPEGRQELVAELCFGPEDDDLSIESDYSGSIDSDEVELVDDSISSFVINEFYRRQTNAGISADDAADIALRFGVLLGNDADTQIALAGLVNRSLDSIGYSDQEVDLGTIVAHMRADSAKTTLGDMVEYLSTRRPDKFIEDADISTLMQNSLKAAVGIESKDPEIKSDRSLNRSNKPEPLVLGSHTARLRERAVRTPDTPVRGH